MAPLRVRDWLETTFDTTLIGTDSTSTQDSDSQEFDEALAVRSTVIAIGVIMGIIVIVCAAVFTYGLRRKARMSRTLNASNASLQNNATPSSDSFPRPARVGEAGNSDAANVVDGAQDGHPLGMILAHPPAAAIRDARGNSPPPPPYKPRDTSPPKYTPSNVDQRSEEPGESQA
ncbi:hypothetical protein diail_1833 [Diaporthe ilicicola]|nr:hypothetical protein diail_1833 [Diaporthe ilicicola]